MPDETLTREVKELVRHLKGDLVGVVPVERFAEAPPGHRPEEFLPGARSVVVWATSYLASTFLSPNPRIYVLRYLQLSTRLQDAGYDVCRFLEEQGHYAINFPSTAPQDNSAETKMLFADFSYRHAAQLAGLGEIGLNQLLVTPEFGPRIRLMAVITTAELSPDSPLTEKVCPREECNVCVENCPAGALSPQGNDKGKCITRYGEYGLSGLLRHIRHILKEKDPAKQKELIFGPTTWGLWMHLQYGGGPSRCNSCIALCPVGWKGPRPPISFKPL